MKTNQPQAKKIRRNISVDAALWRQALVKSKKTGVSISFFLQKKLEEWVAADESKK